jgi:omega-amidase
MLATLAAVQLRIADGDPQANRKRAAMLIQSAAGADLYLLPELWTSGYVYDAWATLADSDAEATCEWMAEQAAAHKAYVGGSLISRDDDGGLVNRFLLFGRDGGEVLRYDKCHLFPLMREPELLTAGKGVPVVELEGLRVAPSICYDLRFPEMYRRVALRGIDLFLVPSEWPHPRQRAMSVLAEARAMENQAFLLLANRCGPDAAGAVFCGHSGFFGPFGAEVTAGEEECVVTAGMDVELLGKARRALAVMDGRLAGIDFD